MIVLASLLSFFIALILAAVSFYFYLQWSKEKDKDEIKNRRLEIEKEIQQHLNDSLAEIAKDMGEARAENLNKLKKESAMHRELLQRELAERTKDFKRIAEQEIKAMEEKKEKVLFDSAAEIDMLEKETQKIVEKLINEQNAINQKISDNLKTINEKDLGRIKMSEIDLLEVAEIESVIKHFRNPIHIRKALFEAYYRNSVREMINLITNGERISGIYKITNVLTDQCYIGQSVNIGDRWLSHIKRGLGTEPLTNNLLYPAMMKDGVINFKFEILEITDALGERERFWGDVYAAKIIGYNLRVG